MGLNKTKKHPFWRRWATQLMLAAMILVLGGFLAFVWHSDLEDISQVADETLDFLRSVCMRYDNYDVGSRASSLKDIFDKTYGMASLASTQDLMSEEYLCRFATTQGLTGILVTDDSLNPVTQFDENGQDAYALWREFLQTESKRDILKQKSKSYTGTVTVNGTEYRVSIVSRRDSKGLIIGYAACETTLTDVYEASLEKTLDNNTFHKNPRIVITDGETIIASNIDTLASSLPVTECPIQDTGSDMWSDDSLIRLDWGGATWYGKRLTYEQYYIYVFYPPDEVFDNMLPVVTTAVAIYALLCLILLLVRRSSERRYYLRDKKQLNTIRAIASLFVTTSILHLKDDTVEGIISTSRAQEILDETTHSREVIDGLTERIIHPDYREQYRTFLDFSTMPERLRGKTSITQVCRDVNGTWFSLYLIPVEYAADGSPTEVLFASRDINSFMQSEQQYQDELRRTAQDAEMANAAKTSFLRRMSHDLRTPINGIRGMASMAEQALDTPARAKDYMEKIISSADYLQSILEDVLRMSKLESGKLELERKSFDLQKVIGETAEFIAERADESDIRFEIDASDIRHTQVIGSPLHLRQVMQNILSNAVKFTPAGGSIRAVCRETGCDGKLMQLEFVCADTGIGMEPEFQQHVFEPFTQEADSARSVFVGTGLGLPIAKEILDLCGGTIDLVSRKGEGSTFTVHLPLEIDAAKETPVLSADNALPIEGLHVLVVEDNDINMEIAHYMLESRGAIVTEAHNGREAVERFRTSAPGSYNVVLMDIMMPEMDGLEATKAIRAMDRPDAKTVPIFAMTANAFVDDINMCMAAGMNEHLAKPLNIDDVIAMICRYCK